MPKVDVCEGERGSDLCEVDVQAVSGRRDVAHPINFLFWHWNKATPSLASLYAEHTFSMSIVNKTRSFVITA
jgi:hypothetical protein